MKSKHLRILNSLLIALLVLAISQFLPTSHVIKAMLMIGLLALTRKWTVLGCLDRAATQWLDKFFS